MIANYCNCYLHQANLCILINYSTSLPDLQVLLVVRLFFARYKYISPVSQLKRLQSKLALG